MKEALQAWLESLPSPNPEKAKAILAGTRLHQQKQKQRSQHDRLVTRTTEQWHRSTESEKMYSYLGFLAEFELHRTAKKLRSEMQAQVHAAGKQHERKLCSWHSASALTTMLNWKEGVMHD